MFDSQQHQYSGTQYTMTAALLIMAFVLSPVIFVLSDPAGYGSIALALAFSSLFVAFAWFTWKHHSELTISSILSRNSRSK
jgi:hypothetical protein